MNKRLRWMADYRMLPFDLDFLRLLGYTFELDWDGRLIINQPESIDCDHMTQTIAEFTLGILRRLEFEKRRAMSICVGGPLNGRECMSGREQVRFHVKRGQWEVYQQKNHGVDDPRYWYVGSADSESKARKLHLSQKPGIM